jgi:hypothetical protein
MKPPTDFNIDFDEAEQNAIEVEFPSARVNRDSYHFINTVMRWTRKHGLQDALPYLLEHLQAMVYAKTYAEWEEAYQMMIERYGQVPYVSPLQPISSLAYLVVS